MAASQVAATILCVALVVVDLRWTAPEVAPSLGLARNDVAWRMVGPSWHFSVLSLSGFLTWQAPVLLMQRILGPVAVTVFALTRTVFTMSRQLLAVASQSIAPEITSLVGRKDWKGLHRLYDLSERVVLLLVPTVSVATLLASPWLMAIWLRQRGLYEPGLCFLMALTSAAMGIKEHKYQFQASSNQHEALSRVMLVAYTSVLAISAVTMRYFGVNGFMWAWLAAEVAQTIAILRMNRKLFPIGDEVTSGPVWRLLVVTTVVFAGSAYPAFHAAQRSLPVVMAVAVVYSVATALVCYKVFGVSEVAEILLRRWSPGRWRPLWLNRRLPRTFPPPPSFPGKFLICSSLQESFAENIEGTWVNIELLQKWEIRSFSLILYLRIAGWPFSLRQVGATLFSME